MKNRNKSICTFLNCTATGGASFLDWNHYDFIRNLLRAHLAPRRLFIEERQKFLRYFYHFLDSPAIWLMALLESFTFSSARLNLREILDQNLIRMSGEIGFQAEAMPQCSDGVFIRASGGCSSLGSLSLPGRRSLLRNSQYEHLFLELVN